MKVLEFLHGDYSATRLVSGKESGVGRFEVNFSLLLDEDNNNNNLRKKNVSASLKLGTRLCISNFKLFRKAYDIDKKLKKRV